MAKSARKRARHDARATVGKTVALSPLARDTLDLVGAVKYVRE